MAMHHVVLILSVCRVWHFNCCSVKRKRKKKREGRKVCITGREEVKGDLWARMDFRTETRLYFGLLRCVRLQKILMEICSCFLRTLVGERNYFTFGFKEGRTMYMSGGQCSLSHKADRGGCQRNEEYDILMKKLIKVSASSRKSLNQCRFLLQTRFKQSGLFLQMHSFSKIYYSKLFSGTNKSYDTVQLQA